jgi:predicted transposase/invertase (TIGR01784 family)
LVYLWKLSFTRRYGKIEESMTGGKESSLDIKVGAGQGERINIEVQLNNVDDFRKRSLYYWRKLYSEGLHESEAYVTLKKSNRALSYDLQAL